MRIPEAARKAAPLPQVAALPDKEEMAGDGEAGEEPIRISSTNLLSYNPHMIW